MYYKSIESEAVSNNTTKNDIFCKDFSNFFFTIKNGKSIFGNHSISLHYSLILYFYMEHKNIY